MRWYSYRWLIERYHYVLKSGCAIYSVCPKCAIGRTAAGNLLIVAVHNRAGGAGPNFAELAQILQQMGAVEALNLDGGSSTSLYLGGSLLDRPPSTAARVHNAIGIFIQP